MTVSSCLLTTICKSSTLLTCRSLLQPTPDSFSFPRSTVCPTAQAICQLPHLTLLTSLTPALEALQLNPQRPHPGCDLAHLAPKASLAGMDVAVLSPEHLAPLAQFSALLQLNLRWVVVVCVCVEAGVCACDLVCTRYCLERCATLLADFWCLFLSAVLFPPSTHNTCTFFFAQTGVQPPSSSRSSRRRCSQQWPACRPASHTSA